MKQQKLQLNSVDQRKVDEVLRSQQMKRQYPLSLDRLIYNWQSLAHTVRQGYDATLYEYINELSSRTSIYLIASELTDFGGKALEKLIKKSDDTFREYTIPMKKSVIKDAPESYWWLFRAPTLNASEWNKVISEQEC
jgi:hypothetical protein